MKKELGARRVLMIWSDSPMGSEEGVGRDVEGGGWVL